MAKIRLHELAKELGIEFKKIKSVAESMGVDCKGNALTALDASQEKKIRGYFMTKTPQGVEEKKESKKIKETENIKTNSDSNKKAQKSPKEKSKPNIVFVNKDSNQNSRAFSTDQKQKYQTPKPKPKVAQQHPVKANESAEHENSAKPRQVTEKTIHASDSIANRPKENQSKPKTDAPVKMTKEEKRSQIGKTVSQEELIARRTPQGRPSVMPSRPSQTKSEGGRPMPAGRPSKIKTNAGGRPGVPSASKDAGSKPPITRKKPSGGPAPVEETIEKSSSSKKKTVVKKKTEPGKDKLEKKTALNRKQLKENIRAQEGSDGFDFGKKKKQKSGKYKSLTEKERSAKLDEALLKQEVLVPEEMTVKQFAEIINKNPNEIIMKLMSLGHMLTINHSIEYETAALIAMDYNIQIELENPVEVDYIEDYDLDFEDSAESLKKRAPVVTVMGHVDHGKTSLLDAIRSTGVASGEAGGITQHIGASEVTHNGERILFLDTPGHEAFTSLRARGAKVTDIAILVVAADDGVMPQTIEAIDHSKAAGVPIIVAINKMDKPNINPDKIKQELADRGLVVEEWGGDVITVPVSAKTGMGLDKLLEMVLLVAEMQDLKANPDRPGIGSVIEAKVVKGRGVVATIILEKGTLKVGDPIVAGKTYGKVKALLNSRGKKLDQIGPSTSVEIDGLNEVPLAGEKFYVTKDERMARRIAEKYAADHRDKTLSKNSSIRLEDLFDKIKEGVMKDLNIIIKADVHGSVEALKTSLQKLTNDEVRINIIRADVGQISETDITLASASKALIIGFNVRPSVQVSSLAEEEGVDIRTYNIIYQAINDVETAMKGMLAPIFKEVILGRAQVRQVFKIPNGVVAGSYITNGKFQRNANVRVLRDGIVVNDSKISSLRRFKDDVKEVATGFECGIGIEKFTDLHENDELEAYILEQIER